MKTDRDLLQSYASGGSEDAFAEIVRRHVNLVYSLAFRQLRGNASLAADATQAVFTSLAAKAATLPHLSNLSSWLYTTTRYTVSHTVRTERRRQERETKAYAMNEATPSDPGCPEMPVELIDAALDSLDDEDREAVLLRFVEGHAFSGVGLALGVSEDAARMRANRALEKIRAFFARQGITSTTAAFAAALTGEGLAAPAGLAGGVCTTAFAKAAGDSGGFLASLSAAKVAAVVSSVVAVAAVACALRPAAPVPAAQETNSQPLAALLSNKAASAMTLSPASPAASRKHTDEEAELAVLHEKLMKQRSALLSGAPITGTFVSTKNGQVTDVPISFALNKATTVDLGDSGIFTVTPTLNDDGSLLYHFENKGTPAGSVAPNVVTAPWGDFTLATKGAVIGFVPDQAEPE